MCTYDSSDNEIFFDDSSSNISLSEDLFSNDSPKFNLPKQNDLKDSESDNSNDDDESELSFVIHRRKVKRYSFTTYNYLLLNHCLFKKTSKRSKSIYNG